MPSIELQTVEFVEAARVLGGARAVELHSGGFRVELEYQTGFLVPGFGDFRGVLIIRRVFVPVRHRECGWLWAYLTMCYRGGGYFHRLHDGRCAGLACASGVRSGIR